MESKLMLPGGTMLSMDLVRRPAAGPCLGPSRRRSACRQRRPRPMCASGSRPGQGESTPPVPSAGLRPAAQHREQSPSLRSWLGPGSARNHPTDGPRLERTHPLAERAPAQRYQASAGRAAASARRVWRGARPAPPTRQTRWGPTASARRGRASSARTRASCRPGWHPRMTPRLSPRSREESWRSQRAAHWQGTRAWAATWNRRSCRSSRPGRTR
eukprot:scaffold1054_cov116-Isochrysis_galbana.AAC.20